MLSIPSLRNSGLNPISSGSPSKAAGIVSWASPTSGVSAATVSSPDSNESRSGALRCASWLTRRVTSRKSDRGSRTSCS